VIKYSWNFKILFLLVFCKEN